jgi:hypothetical protein
MWFTLVGTGLSALSWPAKLPTMSAAAIGVDDHEQTAANDDRP